METRCVPFKFTIEGQEIEAYLTEKNFELVHNLLNKNQKKTGYERVSENEYYWVINGASKLSFFQERSDDADESHYSAANYYESEFVAAQNARADKLMRQLRRFAVEHRENNKVAERYYIYYIHDSNLLQLRRDTMNRFLGPWFDNQHAGAQAIETFRDELIWYFTEYKDSL